MQTDSSHIGTHSGTNSGTHSETHSGTYSGKKKCLLNFIPEEELRAEVGDLAVLCVVQRDGLDAAQDDVLGDLHAEAPQAGDEDVGLYLLLVLEPIALV